MQQFSDVESYSELPTDTLLQCSIPCHCDQDFSADRPTFIARTKTRRTWRDSLGNETDVFGCWTRIRRAAVDGR